MSQLETSISLILPLSGGVTGDPSVLTLVEQFLEDETNLQKVNDLVQGESSMERYRSLVDFLLVELMPEFENDCFQYYAGKGASFHDAHPWELTSYVDAKLRTLLEFLVNQDHPSWSTFKSKYETGLNWELL